MWAPKSWDDVQALVGQAVETPQLEFKETATTDGREIAKDIAAMTVNGGVLLYGIPEDPETGLANPPVPIKVKGLEARLRQIAGSLIAPVPGFDTHFIPTPHDPTEGVLVVEIPPSTLAPHQTGDRYPRRHGTTTAWMDEPEVERFYRQRRELVGEPLRPGHLIEIEFFPAWPEPADNEVGELHLVVRPQSTEVMHPAGPWLAEPLTDAIREATRRQSSRFTNPTLVKCFRRLHEWRPHGVAGWRAGHHAPPTSPLSHTDRFGATHALPARLSFQAQWALLRVDQGGQRLGVSARELDVIRELIAMLAIAGEYFATIDGAGLLFAALRLQGFGGGVSQLAIETNREGNLPTALSGVSNETRTSALNLRDTPETTARRLIEAWLPPFYIVDGEKLDQFGEPVDPFDLLVDTGSP